MNSFHFQATLKNKENLPLSSPHSLLIILLFRLNIQRGLNQIGDQTSISHK